MLNFSFGYTIFNKAHLIPQIIEGIKDVLKENDEAIFLFDACSDNSIEVFDEEKKWLKCSVVKVVEKNELFETRANNRILKIASRGIVVLFQDDMILQDLKIKEKIFRIVKKYGDELGLVGARTGYETDGGPDFRHYAVHDQPQAERGPGGLLLEKGQKVLRGVG